MKFLSSTSGVKRQMKELCEGFGLNVDNVHFLKKPLDKPYMLDGELVQRVLFQAHVRKNGKLCPLQVNNQPLGFFTTVRQETICQKIYMVSTQNSIYKFELEPGDRIIKFK